MCYVCPVALDDGLCSCNRAVFQSHLTFANPLSPRYRGIRYIRYLYPAEPDKIAPLAPAQLSNCGISGAFCITRTTARQLRRFLLRNEPQQRQRAACAIVQPCSNAAAPMLQSRTRRAPQRPTQDRKRDILRRTAMHASHRRELLVPRERRRPVESQRASSHTPREFMAVQKRRFFVLPMPSHPHP